MTMEITTPRKLFVLCDGSSNSTARNYESNPTVIYKLNQALSNGKRGEQISFYFSGVGTHGDRFSAVTGKGLNEIIAEAYVNLASNYVEGDFIYLFGFSRGAMAARCLAGLISGVGLLRDSKLSERFPHVWEAYETMRDRDKEMRFFDSLNDMRDDLLHPRIRFTGVFDTVPGYGYDRLKLTKRYPIKDFTLPKAIEHAVHLVSVDDDRIPSFQPLLWEDKIEGDQTLDQIWMPGVHADVGGCSNAVFIGNLSVLTMLEQLAIHCKEVEFDTTFVKQLEAVTFDAAMVPQITNEWSGFWRKLLNRKKRSATSGIRQSRHYLLQQIAGRRLVIRGKEKVYCARHITSTVKQIHSTGYSSQIDMIVANLLNHAPCCEHCP